MREVERRPTRALGADGWDVDPVPALSGSGRNALQGAADLLERRAGPGLADQGLVIEHEGSTEVRDG